MGDATERQPGDETHETDHPLDHETYYDMEDETERAADETHEASRYTTVEGSKKDSFGMDWLRKRLDNMMDKLGQVMKWPEKTDSKVERLLWKFTELLVMAVRATQEDKKLKME